MEFPIVTVFITESSFDNLQQNRPIRALLFRNSHYQIEVQVPITWLSKREMYNIIVTPKR